MNLKPWQKNILSMTVIVVAGFLLFNIAFMLAALVINGVSRLAGTQEPSYYGVGIYIIIILIISWFVFRSRFNDLIKATFLTMPLMVILITGGISLYQHSKWLIAGIGALFISAVLFYLYKMKLSRLYYFAVIYVAILALCVMIFDVQI
jgi:hypothetical protein